MATTATSTQAPRPVVLSVSVEDIAVLKNVRQAIRMVRGVTSVKMQKTPAKQFDITKTAGYREAMDDVKHGRVYHAESVDDMFQQILGYVPD